MCIVHASQMQAARLARLCVNFEGGRREVDGMGCRIGAGAACLRAAAKIIFAAQGLRNTAGLGVADFPAVFFHICHGTQQAVVTAYREYQNV